MQWKTPFNYCINRKMASAVISSPFPQRRCSSDGRALASLARGTGIDAPHLQFFRGARKSKKNTRSCFVRPKEDLDLYVQYANGRIWNSTELAEEAFSAPNRECLTQKDVEGNITLPIREWKTSIWNKWLLWTPPVRHLNRKDKRLALEKHMDWYWWPYRQSQF